MDVSHKHLGEVAQPIFTVDVCISCQGKILMFKRSDTKKAFPGWWALPGGHIEEGENPLAAAIREVQEETGITISPDDIRLKFVALHHHLDRRELYVVFGFLAILPNAPEHIAENIEGSAHWIERDKLESLENILPPVARYLGHLSRDFPGIIYNNSVWDKSQLVSVLSESIDRNS